MPSRRQACFHEEEDLMTAVPREGAASWRSHVERKEKAEQAPL
jgi:hypothetical protein